jgi:hypothetical protein
LNAPANPNDPKGWSVFWKWPVIAVFATLIFSLGVGAVWEHEYSLGACLIVGSTTWAAAKASETFGRLTATLLGFAVLVPCFLGIEYHLEHTQVPGVVQDPLITWKTPSPIEAGIPLSEKQLNASASFGGKPVDGRFVYNPALGATLAVGSDTLSVTFYPTDLTKYSTQAQTTTLIVSPRNNSPNQPTLRHHGVVQPQLPPPANTQITCQQAIEVCSIPDLIQRALILQQRIEKFADDWRDAEERARSSAQKLEANHRSISNCPLQPPPPDSSQEERQEFSKCVGFETWLQNMILDVIFANQRKYNDQFRTDAIQIRDELVNRYPPGRTLPGYSEYDKVVLYQGAYEIVAHLGNCMNALRDKP